MIKVPTYAFDAWIDRCDEKGLNIFYPGPNDIVPAVMATDDEGKICGLWVPDTPGCEAWNILFNTSNEFWVWYWEQFAYPQGELTKS